MQEEVRFLFFVYAKPSTRVSLIPAIREVSCPPSLNAASITLISVAVVSSPVKEAQSDGVKIEGLRWCG